MVVLYHWILFKIGKSCFLKQISGSGFQKSVFEEVLKNIKLFFPRLCVQYASFLGLRDVNHGYAEEVKENIMNTFDNIGK